MVNGTANAGPHQIKRAEITPASSPRGGELTASYDAAGNMIRMDVDRNGTCLATTTGATPGCALVFKYEWDEKNRLTRACRWDRVDVDADSPPNVTNTTDTVDLRYRYDADDNRVVKWAFVRDTNNLRPVDNFYTAYVFDSLELRRTEYGTPTANEYKLDETVEGPYLFASGVRLARVVYEPLMPASSPANQHVLLELGDHLGSTSTVLDLASGELVQKSTFQAYGGSESDHRPGRWAGFREDYRFTGKEEDVEVGVVYFGKRYLNPLLGRWLNPDPLALHDAGKADLNLYAYVRGMALKAVDPLGLAETSVMGPDGANMSVQVTPSQPDNASYPVAAEDLQSVETPIEVYRAEKASQNLAMDRPSELSPVQADDLLLGGALARGLAKLAVKAGRALLGTEAKGIAIKGGEEVVEKTTIETGENLAKRFDLSKPLTKGREMQTGIRELEAGFKGLPGE